MKEKQSFISEEKEVNCPDLKRIKTWLKPRSWNCCLLPLLADSDINIEGKWNLKQESHPPFPEGVPPSSPDWGGGGRYPHPVPTGMGVSPPFVIEYVWLWNIFCEHCSCVNEIYYVAFGHKHIDRSTTPISKTDTSDHFSKIWSRNISPYTVWRLFCFKKG